MTNNKDIVIDCLEVTQPVGRFYIATMDYKDLLFISYADRRIIADINSGLNHTELEEKDSKQMCKYCPWNWMKQGHCGYYLNFNEVRKGSAYYKQSVVDKRVREIKRWIKALEKGIKP